MNKIKLIKLKKDVCKCSNCNNLFKVIMCKNSMYIAYYRNTPKHCPNCGIEFEESINDVISSIEDKEGFLKSVKDLTEEIDSE